jgi:hypothetical protein
MPLASAPLPLVEQRMATDFGVRFADLPPERAAKQRVIRMNPASGGLVGWSGAGRRHQ